MLTDAERRGAQAFVLGGDAAAGPMPAETIDLLMTLGDRARFVRGNADREVVNAYDRGHTAFADAQDPAPAARFAAARISRPQRDFLDALGPVLFCHGLPRGDTEIITFATSERRLRNILAGVRQHLVVGGHTHQQFDRRAGSWRIVNAGSGRRSRFPAI